MQRIKESIFCWGLVLVIIATIIIPLGKAILVTEMDYVLTEREEVYSIMAQLEELN